MRRSANTVLETPRLARPRRSGLSVVELLIVLAVIGILSSLLLPAVQHSRELARRSRCGDQLRQIAIAAHGHESARGAFPYAATNYVEWHGVTNRVNPAISPHRFLMAYLYPDVYGKIDFGEVSAAVDGRPPYVWNPRNAALMRLGMPVFACPSDDGPAGRTNYRANLGPGPWITLPHARVNLGDPANGTGAFVNGRAVPAAEFRDGLSHTALFSEKLVGDGDPDHYTPYRDRFQSPVQFLLVGDAIEACRGYAVASPGRHDSYSGFTWLLGGYNYTWYNHILTPNSPIPDCSTGIGILGGGCGIYTARSFHPGGVNVLFADAAARFVGDAMDLAVWRALSTRKGGEGLQAP